MKKAWFILLAVAAATGCLEKETTNTLYLEADGSVTWEVFECDVYSSAEEAEDRLREEDEYLRRAIAGRPTIVESLEEIGGLDAQAQLLRDRKPFSLRATARFNDLEHALAGLFEAAEIGAEARLEEKGSRRILTIRPFEIERGNEDWTVVHELFRSDELRFVIVSGKFEEAEGFSIEEQGRAAVWSDETYGDDEEPALMRLAWSVPD